ncbi:hypothetical protein WN48_05128 [Eufriesea mexicana]|nr:hypothetical protein WN48_05128 [Eufriesea mexicana]
MIQGDPMVLCIQVDYLRLRTFSVDYAIDLDKNGAKNNDCGYEYRNEVKRMKATIFLPTPRVFGLGPDFDTGYPVLFTGRYFIECHVEVIRGATPPPFFVASSSSSEPRKPSPLLLFAPLMAPP